MATTLSIMLPDKCCSMLTIASASPVLSLQELFFLQLYFSLPLL
jgi:hypothetical protein